jgi:hypothetical protein
MDIVVVVVVVVGLDASDKMTMKVMVVLSQGDDSDPREC